VSTLRPADRDRDPGTDGDAGYVGQVKAGKETPMCPRSAADRDRIRSTHTV